MTAVEEKVILVDSPEAAHLATNISGWVSANGYFYGKDEAAARQQGCTHRRCEGDGCLSIIEKHKTFCDSCGAKRKLDRYQKLEPMAWDGETFPVYSKKAEEYFHKAEELEYFLEEYEEYSCLAELWLVSCKPVYAKEKELPDIFDVDRCEWENAPPGELETIVEKINVLIRAYTEPLYYVVGDFRLEPTADAVELFKECFKTSGSEVTEAKFYE